jgi:hypothetical protein
MMPGEALTAADADGLRDLAGRPERAAKTARRAAVLLDLAQHAEGIAFTASAVAKHLDPDDETG